MNEEILEKYWQYLRREYRKTHTQKNYYRFVRKFLKWIEETKGKTYTELTPADTKDYKAYCVKSFKVNGNVGRLNAVNNFVHEFLGKKKLRITAPKSEEIQKDVLDSEELERYKNGAQTPLEKLIVTYQIEAYLRPSDFYNLRISRHNKKTQIVYTDDSKTGNTRVILTPNMEKAYDEYLLHRTKPKREEDEDKLIIVDKGSNYGLAPSPDSDFIYRQTKKIAARAGFNRSVYPYLIKPSAITDAFNRQVNPKIIRKQARHKNIETTLRYDQTSDEMAKEYFNRTQKQLNMDNLTPEDKAKVWLDKLLVGEIDLKTFKTGLDVLLPDKRKGEDIGYI